jgi:hypothetical protein
MLIGLANWPPAKAMHNPPKQDMANEEARLHRIITVAAAAFNWHASVLETA